MQYIIFEILIYRYTVSILVMYNVSNENVQDYITQGSDEIAVPTKDHFTEEKVLLSMTVCSNSLSNLF